MDTARDGSARDPLPAPHGRFGASTPIGLVAPDDEPVRPGAMCGACGSGRYLGHTQQPGRVVCTRCGNGRPALS